MSDDTRRNPPQAAAGSSTRVQIDPNVLRVVDPLKTEVEALRAEVNRLKAALESLRLSVNAQHEAYRKHQHAIPHYGVTTAKTICPHTTAIDGTMVVFTTAGGAGKGLSGPPE